MPSLLPTPEPADPVEGQPGHFEHSNWLKASVKALDSGVVHKAGDTLTGPLVFGGGISLKWPGADRMLYTPEDGTDALMVLNIAGGAATIQAAPPVVDADVATKGFVAGRIQGGIFISSIVNRGTPVGGTITFPIPFSAPPIVVAGFSNSPSDSQPATEPAGAQGIYVTGITTHQFSYTMVNFTVDCIIGGQWIAIGR